MKMPDFKLDEREYDAELVMLLHKLMQNMPVENISDLFNYTLADPEATRAPSTVEAFEIAAPTALWIDRIVTPIWYIIGAIGNPITMKIWLSRRMRESNSSAIYIGSIAIVQFVFIFLHAFLELHIAWDISTYNTYTSCEIFNVFYITPQYLSPLLILGFTVERYIAVCHPFRKEKFCTVRRAGFVVGFLGIVSLCLGSVQAYIWTYDKPRNVCYFRKGAKPFYNVWTWFSEMLIFAVVPLTVLFFNVLVIREIKMLTRRASFRMPTETVHRSVGNQTSTMTLLSVSFYLICTLLPATIVYAIQSLIPTGDHTMPVSEWSADPIWRRYLTYYTIRKIVEEICFSNYACYAFIYYITGSYYRNEVHKILCFRACQPRPKRIQQKSKSQGDQYTLVTTNGKPEADFSSTVF